MNSTSALPQESSPYFEPSVVTFQENQSNARGYFVLITDHWRSILELIIAYAAHPYKYVTSSLPKRTILWRPMFGDVRNFAGRWNHTKAAYLYIWRCLCSLSSFIFNSTGFAEVWVLFLVSRRLDERQVTWRAKASSEPKHGRQRSVEPFPPIRQACAA